MKFIIKIGAYCVAVFLLLPLIIGQRISNKFANKDRVFHTISQVLSLVPSRLGVYLRAAFYSNVCNSVNREISIGFFTLFSHVDLDIGKNVYIGSQCNIGSCAIGNDCLLGSGVHVLSGKQQHNFSDSSKPIRLQSGSFIKVKIGENCWIGNQACILADVGSHSIVAAGSVVVTDVPANSIVAGNPAKIIKKR